MGHEVFNVQTFTQYLTSLFTEMQGAGLEQIELSFAQLCDIDAYAAGDFSKASPNDVIATLMQQMQSSNVYFPPGVDILNLITTTANQMHMNVALSFGGQNASPTDFTLCQSGETPEGQADKLATFMQQNGIASVDFDVEGGNALALGSEPGAVAFFSTLKSQLDGMGKTSTLTIQGSLTQTVWGTGNQDNPSTFNGPLVGFFYNADLEPIFPTVFSSLNLMMYDSGAHYYLDAKVFPGDTLIPDWCIEQWLDILGQDNANLIHIGFQDATQYQLAASSASGHTYFEDPTDPSLAVLPTDSSGTAGAKIFLQIQQQLIADGYPTPLASPFWWPNYAGNRYAPAPGGGAQFVSQEMSDFYTAL